MFVAMLALGVCGGVVRNNATAASASGTDMVCVDRQTTRIASPPVFEGGTPILASVFGTSLYYVVNTSAAVLKTPDETWFSCENGVWFTAESGRGPWRVATALPSDIGRIPQGHILHFLTFARLREYDGRYVWFEVTPGYYDAAPPPPAPATAPEPSSVSVNYTYTVTPVFVPWSGHYQWGVGIGMGHWGSSHGGYYGAGWTGIYCAPVFYSCPLVVWCHPPRPLVIYRQPLSARRWAVARPAPLPPPRPGHPEISRHPPHHPGVIMRPPPPRPPVRTYPRPIQVKPPGLGKPSNDDFGKPVSPVRPNPRPMPPPRPVERPAPPNRGERPVPPSKPIERPMPPGRGERPTPPAARPVERPAPPSGPVERPAPPAVRPVERPAPPPSRGDGPAPSLRPGKERDAK